MAISQDIIGLAAHIDSRLGVPPLNGFYLPPLTDTDEFKDEFGFILLEDGSVGPFYVSLPGELEALWAKYPERKLPGHDALTLINNLNGDDITERAIAIGAYNALSHHVFTRSGYFPGRLSATGNGGIPEPQPGDRIGMVGYFQPLLNRFLPQGIEVLVLELNPARVEQREGLTLSTKIDDLANCQYIICTASTLINNTLESILAVKARDARLILTGPSSSGLPDVLFKHGVDAVGGTCFTNSRLLQELLANDAPWKDAGKKYQINSTDYPGVEKLLG